MKRFRVTTPVLCLLSLTSCGGDGRTPPSGGGIPGVIPTPVSWAIAGTVSDAVTGAPIGGATLSFAGQPPLTTDTDGTWTLKGTGGAATRQVVTITAPGYVDHETSVRWESGGRQDVAVTL